VSAARRWLAPLSSVYGAAVRLRNRRYERPGASRRAPVPVLSVGNLTVGGTGKTPMVAWLCRHLLELGRRPAVVSRGYGGAAGRGPLVVSDGSGPRVGAARCGDEPFMLARALPGVRVIVGSDRTAGAAAAAADRADVVVLDDGYQHRRLARDLDIVLLDAATPLAAQRLLPAGDLREPLSGLGRAGAVVLTRYVQGAAATDNERTVRRLTDAPLLHAVHHACGFVDLERAPVEAPARALAFCAIGNPHGFRDDLVATGIDVVGFRSFRDHHRFTDAEIAALVSEARQSGTALVTTEKDLARLAARVDRFGDRPPVGLAIELRVVDPEPLLAAVRSAVGLDGASR
jgi:tetraacyldisaccharide 4'-kinase